MKLEWAAFELKVGKSEIDRIIRNGNGKRARSRWNERAAKVGMSDQYEFLYSYTSRLLHALPFSFYTDQKNLEYREVETFLEFTYVSLLDIIDLGKKRISGRAGDTSSSC